MNTHTPHIVRITADIGSITVMNREQVARGQYAACINYLRSNAEQIGVAPFDGGLFLVSHEGLLRFLASQPTYDPVIQIEVFSLQGEEAQIVPRRDGEDSCAMVRYRIAK